MINPDLQKLCDRMDRLKRERARAISLYDRSPDGSSGKRLALMTMDRLSVEIYALEQEINTIIPD